MLFRSVAATEATLPDEVARTGAFDIVVEASGAAELIAPAAMAVGMNGVLLLTSVTSHPVVVPVDLAAWNQSFVLGNRVMVGTVNSAPVHFAAGVALLARAHAELPEWADRLITHRIDGLDPVAIADRLRLRGDAIKTVVHIAGRGTADR